VEGLNDGELTVDDTERQDENGFVDCIDELARNSETRRILLGVAFHKNFASLFPADPYLLKYISRARP
jgi:hypothetical protein